MDRIKFVIAEKSYLIRKGIASIINRIERATVVKELESLDEINSVLLKYNPDFLVISLSLINLPLEFINSDIKADLSVMGIGIVSGVDSPGINNSGLREFISVLDERAEIYNKLETLIKDKVSRRISVSQQTGLSEREKTILTNVARGLTNKEIAEKLFLSAHTVITHRKNITNKLGIKTISGLTVYAILNNLVNIEDLE